MRMYQFSLRFAEVDMHPMTDLVYNVCSSSLTGSIDGVNIVATAVSGGRAGSKLDDVVQDFIANNPFTTGIKLKNGGVGGVLPLTEYRMRTHEDREKRPNWIRLIPIRPDEMRGRDGMAIHGSGPRGSDGCIVPTDFNIVKELYRLVKAREDAHKAAPTLAVVAIGDIDFYIERAKKYRSLA
ncbi:hypothetical protein ATO4_24756 [Aurantimonas sp. 22II-16-19i]|nr:hypothetical protein ATO4_24756 [Aurantimonas sp. 22II-16-19i]